MAQRTGTRHVNRSSKYGKGARAKQQRKNFRKERWENDMKELETLKKRYEDIDSASISKFTDFPLSKKTRDGLLEAGYDVPTEIQRETIGVSLKGHDVLGAAKTGSGKTLAFLLPVIECLYQNRWTAIDGLGALIISPTRELAYQTFEVLCKIGKHHDFSAGLIIGGKPDFLKILDEMFWVAHITKSGWKLSKDLQEEADKIHRTNIIICTPGRLLQHMDETSYFDCCNLLMLVLDEADRILDLGFEKTMNAIIENLPPERQTLLFSATQTKSVRDLARLSLKDPKYISVHQHHEYSTPAQLEQSYVVCELHQKLNMLYSFIRNHLKKKTLVFMASCKQVKYVYEAICRLRPGITVMALYGKLNQLRRVAVYNEFCKKENAVLIATDIAARGLDFPAVHWVLQLDCPEDASTYIHRAGRTARYQDDGESLLVLLPSEEKNMLHQLVERKIPIQKIRINPDKLIQIQNKLQAICAKNYEMKQSAQRCFISYLRSIYLMKNKDVFDINKLTTDEYATSLGLVISPRIRFLQRAEKLREKQMAEKISSTKTETKITPQTSSGGSEEDESENEDSNSNHGDKNKLIADKDIKISLDDSDDDILTVKTKNVFEEDSQSSEEDTEEDTVEVREETVTVSVKPEEENEKKDLKVPVKTNPKKKLSKAALAKKLARKKYKVNQKIIFDEEGEVAQQFPPVQKTFIQMDEDDDKGGINIDKTVVLMREEDKHDKQVFRQRVKDKHRAEKLKKKAGRKRRKRGDESEEEDIGVQLSINPEDECNIDLLPDPDQYFNKSEKHSHAEKEFSFSNTKKKRKKQADVKKKMLIDDMGLKEEEELALHLLMKDS